MNEIRNITLNAYVWITSRVVLYIYIKLAVHFTSGLLGGTGISHYNNVKQAIGIEKMMPSFGYY